MKKTKTVSFRINENIILELEREARNKASTTNYLINQVLHNYIIWERYREKTRMCPVPEDNIKHFLEKCPDSERSIAIGMIYNSIKEFSFHSYKKFDLKTCLDTLEAYCTICGFSTDTMNVGGTVAFLIRHSLGQNFSTFAQELIEKIFYEITGLEIDIRVTDNTILIRFKESFLSNMSDGARTT